MQELTIFRDLHQTLRGKKIEEALFRMAEQNDKITTILLCSRAELAYYLICDDPVLRVLAERKNKSYE